MTHFLRNKDDEILEGNTHYWKIVKLLPVGVREGRRRFKLHGTTWTYAAYFRDGFLYAVVNSIHNDPVSLEPFLAIRFGIVGDDLQEIVALNASMFYGYELISCSQLDSILLTSKCLYLFAEIERMDENGQKIKVRNKKMQEDFKELMLSGKNSDVTLEVKQKKFNCHRCILGSRSSVFAAMFEHDMKGKAGCVVTIEDAEPAVFEEFLFYLYSGNDDLLSWKNNADLYKLADRYGVEDMKISCLDEIKRNINGDNFFEYFKLSRLYNYSNIAETVIRYFLKYSTRILRRQSWVTHLYENPVECNVLITAVADELSNMVSNS